MKSIRLKTSLASFVIASAALTVSVAIGVAPVAAADSGKKGDLQVTKECSGYTFLAGDFCTITSSNLAEIPVKTKIYYTQAFGIVEGLLDSNVILDAGSGSRALGRCTLDSSTGLGVCTFSDGTGELAEFHARVSVSSLGGVDWGWEGTYSFSK